LDELFSGVDPERFLAPEEDEGDHPQRERDQVVLRQGQGEPVRKVEAGDLVGRLEPAGVQEGYVFLVPREPVLCPEGVAERVEHRLRPEGDYRRPARRHRGALCFGETQEIASGRPNGRRV
jgi:hypothetical protein